MIQKQPWYKKIADKAKDLWQRGKNYAIALTTVFVTASPAVASVNAANNTAATNSAHAQEIENILTGINKLNLEKYKGHQVDLQTFSPEQVGHLFESGLNPCVTDGQKPISQAGRPFPQCREANCQCTCHSSSRRPTPSRSRSCNTPAHTRGCSAS